jgi:hypothetical protein
MNRAIPIVACAFAAGCTLLPGCGTATQGCTELGCGPSFRIELTRPTWQAGEYRLEVTADGVTRSCTVTLPFASCSNLVACDRADPAFLVETSGCALAPAEHAIVGIIWPVQGPAEVTLEVAEGATTLGTGSYQPAYATSQPNGLDCEPTCSQADSQPTLALP